MKKVGFLVIVSASLALLGAGCGPTPQQKVDQLEKDKAAKVENSGYKECVQKVNDRQAEQQKCENDALTEAGYTDGIDCISDFDATTMSQKHPEICNTPDQKRYNAQVKARNDCLEKLNDPKALNLLDCAKLLEQ